VFHATKRERNKLTVYAKPLFFQIRFCKAFFVLFCPRCSFFLPMDGQTLVALTATLRGPRFPAYELKDDKGGGA